jgi:hypothetical protein
VCSGPGTSAHDEPWGGARGRDDKAEDEEGGDDGEERLVKERTFRELGEATARRLDSRGAYRADAARKREGGTADGKEAERGWALRRAALAWAAAARLWGTGVKGAVDQAFC